MSSTVRLPRPAAAALALALLACAGPATAQDYPRLGLYGVVFGDGYPLWDAGGTFDPAAFDAIARYDEVVLDASPISEYRPDALLALRQRHPSIKLLAYVMGHFIWWAQSPDSLVHYPTRYWRLVRDMNGFLYNTRGEIYGRGAVNVNLAKRDLFGRFVVAEAVADLFYDAVLRQGIWDGLFVDTFCSSILFTESTAESIDIVRAGYFSRAAFDAAWNAATDTLASRLRARGGGSAILVGNCGRGNKYAWFNGWMRENFPYQIGGNWYSNMYDTPGGYFGDDQRFRAPPHNFLFSASLNTNVPYEPYNTQKVRFGLGSAALGEGYGVFGPAARSVKDQPFHTWWYDEYAVDLATGSSSPFGQQTGWLGQPLGAPHQMIWLGPGADAVTNPGFETDVTSGWTLAAGNPATVVQDNTTAAVGSASAHLHIDSVDPLIWRTTFATNGTLSIVSGWPCSATFWARASAPRSITVAAGRIGGGDYGARVCDITTEWKRYQVTIMPFASGAATLQFHLAGAAGDVWLDDVHFQMGVTSVYRRDFQNGIVLVNPAPMPQSVVLERPFRRILGTVDPVVNDGLESASIDVPAMDARFLIGADVVPPATVNDMRVQPSPQPGPR